MRIIYFFLIFFFYFKATSLQASFTALLPLGKGDTFAAPEKVHDVLWLPGPWKNWFSNERVGSVITLNDKGMVTLFDTRKNKSTAAFQLMAWNSNTKRSALWPMQNQTRLRFSPTSGWCAIVNDTCFQLQKEKEAQERESGKLFIQAYKHNAEKSETFQEFYFADTPSFKGGALVFTDKAKAKLFTQEKCIAQWTIGSVEQPFKGFEKKDDIIDVLAPNGTDIWRFDRAGLEESKVLGDGFEKNIAKVLWELQHPIKKFSINKAGDSLVLATDTTIILNHQGKETKASFEPTQTHCFTIDYLQHLEDYIAWKVSQYEALKVIDPACVTSMIAVQALSNKRRQSKGDALYCHPQSIVHFNAAKNFLAYQESDKSLILWYLHHRKKKIIACRDLFKSIKSNQEGHILAINKDNEPFLLRYQPLPEEEADWQWCEPES